MSARAAWRLETLGFTQVYRYTAGKMDWLAFNLPSEGTSADVPRVVDLARSDAPSCRIDESLEMVRERVHASDWDVCVVVNEACVVLGLLRHQALDGSAQTVVEAMEPGPRTYRPYVPPARAADSMRRRGIDSVLVTNSDGQLLGVLRRADAERAASGGDA